MRRVMIVDDNMANLIMAKKTLEGSYEVIPVSSGISALECLNDMPDLPDLVLLDVDMPNVNGFQVISEMKCIPKLANIPIIFLTAQDDDTTELESYNLGATDYIRKPYTASLLKKHVDVQMQMLEQKEQLSSYNSQLSSMVQEKVKKIIELQYSTVEMIVDLMDKRDGFSGGHARRVERYLDILLSACSRASKCDLSADDIATICFASKIHDVGKICLQDALISFQPGVKKTEYELKAMETHTILGADSIHKVSNVSSGNNFLSYACTMAKSHHEKYDGSGYPEGLRAKKIPFEARALAIVNTYDNLRMGYLQDKPLSHEEACNRIRFQKFSAFDPELVDIFLTVQNDIFSAAASM